MHVRFYKPARSTMQSGMAKAKKWHMAFAPSASRHLDPLMGWAGTQSTNPQRQLTFDTLEEAIAYAQAQGYTYTVQSDQSPTFKPKSYADNFSAQRLE
jgi:hypothetical protein